MAGNAYAEIPMAHSSNKASNEIMAVSTCPNSVNQQQDSAMILLSYFPDCNETD